MMWTASALLGSGDGGRGGRGEDDGAPPCGWWPRRKETRGCGVVAELEGEEKLG